MQEILTERVQQADAAAEAAMRSRDEFRNLHHGYFDFCRRRDENGKLMVPVRPELDRESYRLSVVAARCNKVAADVEYEERIHSDEFVQRDSPRD